jgi:dihydroflavonol-4-reductase
LVTGGSGFIGKHLVATLVARGDFVRILDLATPVPPAGAFEFVQGSILDRGVVSRALEGIDHVYHLAGMAHLWAPRPGDFDLVNRVGSETVLSVAAGRKLTRYVHCSTESILLPRGEGPDVIDETVSLTVDDMPGPYSRSKYLAEEAARSAARSGMPVVIVNPTVPVGPEDRRMTPPTAMLARFLAARVPVSLNFALNLVDVRDLARGMMLAADRGRIGHRYILGGENMSMRQLAQALEPLIGKKPVRYWISPALAKAAGGASEWLATHVTGKAPAATLEGVRLALRSRPLDIAKARNELGYEPHSITGALVETVAWLSNLGSNTRVSA